MRIATYTDGTPVLIGDTIRYRQQPGGLLPASPEWTYGIAAYFPPNHEGPGRARLEAYISAQSEKGYGTMLDPDEIHLKADVLDYKGDFSRVAYFGIVGHIVEKA